VPLLPPVAHFPLPGAQSSLIPTLPYSPASLSCFPASLPACPPARLPACQFSDLQAKKIPLIARASNGKKQTCPV